MFKVIKKDDELGAYIEDINLSNISKKTSIGLLSCLAVISPASVSTTIIALLFKRVLLY